MDFENEMKQFADGYRAKGYSVVLRPGPNDLPPFAKDFKVELLCKRGAEGVLVAVKQTRSDVSADANLSRYAEVTASQTGWRFDLAVLQAENPKAREIGPAMEFSQADIDKALREAEQVARMGFIRPAVIAAWSGLEAAMRMRLRAAGEKAEWGAPPRTMLTELYSSGILSAAEFRQLVAFSQLRNQIVHGFAAHAPDAGTPDAEVVQFLSDIARRLVSESQSVKQPA